jgi:Ran GTPase-activating protein (RanGAP) involved in mRNA processing and transport
MSEALAGPDGNHTLRTLCIGSQQFSAAGVNALASHLGQWNAINVLDLELKNLGPDGVIHLGTSLAANTSIHTLTLARNPLTDEGILALLRHMYADDSSKCSLTSLSLAETEISCASIEAFASVCSANSLEELKLDRNESIGAGCSADMTILPQLLSNASPLRCLRSLSMARCSLGDLGIAQLSEGLSTCASVLELDFSHNRVGPDGARALSAAFTSGGAPNLRALVLNGNDIGSSGAASLAGALGSQQRSPTLRKLNLQSCKIGSEGAAAVGTHFAGLVELNVMDCNLGDQGVLNLMSSFTAGAHGSLRSLNLCANDVTDVGGIFACEKIVEMFPIEMCEVVDESTGRSEVTFVLGLGANKDLGVGTTVAVERLLEGRRGFQVAQDKGDDGSGEMATGEPSDIAKFDQMMTGMSKAAE